VIYSQEYPTLKNINSKNLKLKKTQKFDKNSQMITTQQLGYAKVELPSIEL
jgi:hypothetical protein